MSSRASYFDLKDNDFTEPQTRMDVLLKYGILDTEPEQSFDDITELLTLVTSCPVATITFIDTDKKRNWIKSSKGIEIKEFPLQYEQTALPCKSCVTRVCEFQDPFLPNIAKTLGFQYWAKFPLCSPEGYHLGDVSVLDRVPRVLTTEQRAAAIRLSRQTSHLLELRLKVNELGKVNKERSSFLGMISHDIRQPLGNIMLSCELMSQDIEKLQKEHLELIQTVHASAGLMHNLVDDLLEMVKLDFGRLEVELDIRPTDLGRLIARTVRMNEMMAAKKNIKLEFGIRNSCGQGTVIPWSESSDHCLSFYLDAIKIEQALNNLISNAMKFSYPGSKVEICTEKKVEQGLVEIIITDHGQGIPPEDMKYLFKAFSRLSVKPTGGEGSTGLGLCIVKNIIEAHKGNIQVESVVEEGTTFRIVLPLVPVQPPTRKSSDRISLTSSVDISHKTPELRILVAEDNVTNQKLMSQVLSKRGYSIEMANDGVEALEIFERDGGHDSFDVLLIDEEMPRMNGKKVIEIIRQKELFAGLNRIPIISISGHATEEHWRTMKQIGVDQCIAKPFNIKSLISVIESHGLMYKSKHMI